MSTMSVFPDCVLATFPNSVFPPTGFFLVIFPDFTGAAGGMCSLQGTLKFI